MSTHHIPLHPQVEVIQQYECGLIALYKAANILTHPNRESDIPASVVQAHYHMEEEYYHWEDELGHEQRCYLVHRLDSPTSGILLVATHHGLAQHIKTLFAQHKVQKTYHAIVAGHLHTTHERWQDRLQKKKGPQRVRSQAASHGSTAITQVQRLDCVTKGRTLSLLALSPLTGRTHQLRIQCALHQLPILGDRTYGDFPLNRWVKQTWNFGHLFLHAQAIALQFYWQNHHYSVDLSIDSPSYFQRIMRPPQKSTAKTKPKSKGLTVSQLLRQKNPSSS